MSNTIEIHDISDRPQFAWAQVACRIGACSCKAKREEKALWEEYRASNAISKEEAFASLRKQVVVPANDQSERDTIAAKWLSGELASPEEEEIAAYLAA